MMYRPDIKGVKVLGRDEWRATADAPKPDVSFLPMMERRRLSALERAALHVAWNVFRAAAETQPAASEMPVVFASRWGEIGTTLKLMRQMHDEGEMSPAGFASSVHNAAPGAWSLFTKNRAPYTAIAARDRSYEMGLVETEAQLAAGARQVLYVYAEEATPDYYLPAFGEPMAAQAVAMLMARELAT